MIQIIEEANFTISRGWAIIANVEQTNELFGYGCSVLNIPKLHSILLFMHQKGVA